jgi:hypothetical protein
MGLAQEILECGRSSTSVPVLSGDKDDMLVRNLPAIASVILLPAPAFAQAEPLSAEIVIGDLDLSSETGQARFGRRLR